MKTKIQFHNENVTLAKSLANTIAQSSWVHAVLLYGSVGKGYSDQSSDIDLLVICDDGVQDLYVKTESIKQLFPQYDLLFKQQELSVLQFDNYPTMNHASENYPSYRAACSINYQGRMIDTTIRLISKDVIESLVDAAKNDMYVYQTLVQYFIDTCVMYDRDGILPEWKSRVGSFKTFAPELYQKFLDYCFSRIDYYLHGEIPDGIARNDVLLVHHELGKCLVLIVHVIYALNDKCLSYPKWEHEDMKKLLIKPDRVHEILEQVIKAYNPELLVGLVTDLKRLSKNVQ